MAVLPAKEQVKAVADQLQERNLGFDGKVTPTIDKNGVVTELVLLTDKVTDIAPLRALPGLRSLHAKASDHVRLTGALTDLWPLRGCASPVSI